MKPDFQYNKVKLYNCDNMEFMKNVSNNYYDLAIVDPPYGINADIKNNKGKKQSRKSATESIKYGDQKWDSKVPEDTYFSELKRVSKRQIIWGANYFNLQGGMLYWHKNVTMPTYSTGEIAYLSWLNKIDFVNLTWHGMIQENMKNKEKRIHPTQKPVALYKWLLSKYANKGDKIIDTHGGSCSIGCACLDMSFDIDIMEIDKDYFDGAVERLSNNNQIYIDFT